MTYLPLSYEAWQELEEERLSGGYGHSWANDFNTFQEACDYYGCDGPRQLAAEEAYEAQEYANQLMDRMEAGEIQPALADQGEWYRPHPEYMTQLDWSDTTRARPYNWTDTPDEIPF